MKRAFLSLSLFASLAACGPAVDVESVSQSTVVSNPGKECPGGCDKYGSAGLPLPQGATVLFGEHRMAMSVWEHHENESSICSATSNLWNYWICPMSDKELDAMAASCSAPNEGTRFLELHAKLRERYADAGTWECRHFAACLKQLAKRAFKGNGGSVAGDFGIAGGPPHAWHEWTSSSGVRFVSDGSSVFSY